MTPTVWFLIILFLTGDHVSLGSMPVEFATQKECSTAGMNLMIDRRNKKVKLHCIEAGDEADLSKILRANFNFGGQGI